MDDLDDLAIRKRQGSIVATPVNEAFMGELIGDALDAMVETSPVKEVRYITSAPTPDGYDDPRKAGWRNFTNLWRNRAMLIVPVSVIFGLSIGLTGPVGNELWKTRVIFSWIQ